MHYVGDPQGKAAGRGGPLQDCSQPHLQRALQTCAEKPAWDSDTGQSSQC